ncbi:hypothetical protein U9M48_006918 [Paspalum notatum var. saurae]|uniref:Integrase catalytic domain-containing protein n=1 Tax=Paspalum notatum var. saurae TaxID=547442 RepID=A0AAQ3Q0X2_PASNO
MDSCAKKPRAQVHALALNDLDKEIPEAVLNQLAVEDAIAEEFCNLSLNALAPPKTVKVANGQTLISDKVIPNLSWWCQGSTFKVDMRVLDMGAYDAILGFDWLQLHSPMVCDWTARTLEFKLGGQLVKLQGINPAALEVQSVSGAQLSKWIRGNDVWALALFPMPVIEEILEELDSAKYFTKLDMSTSLEQHVTHVELVLQKLREHQFYLKFNFSQPFTIETDACDNGMGAVLMQNARPMAYLKGYSLEQGLIKHKGIWLGNNSAIQTKIIAALHASPIGAAWQDISMDFIKGLPSSDGYNVILVVMDRFTKCAHFIAIKHPYTAQSIARIILDQVIRLHGFPKTIVSDRDPVFLSSFWKELFRLYDVKLQMSTAYHPQTDGQTERVNQCLEMYLRCVIHDTPKQWKKWLSLAELWYNSSYHSAINCSPFKALYGQEPNLMAETAIASSTVSVVNDILTERALQLENLKHHLEVAQNRMKQHADRQRTELTFQVGEQVLLKLQPYAQTSLVNRPFPKLAFKFFGPYKVVERIGEVAYRLELPPHSNIHLVFHVSQLKPFTADYSPVFSELPNVPILDAKSVEPAAVLERRLVKKGNHAITQVRVQWTALPPTATTWEDYHVVRARFPSAAAWGQAPFQEGGVVTDASVPREA